MDIIIRECCIDDVLYIHKLNSEDLGYTYPIVQTRQKLHKVLNSKTDRVFVAVIDEHVVGYVHSCDYDVLYAPTMKNIMGIAVSKEYRRMGIGKALLAAVDNWARGTGAAGVRLVSGAERPDAHVFYQKCGYTKVKNQLNFRKWF